MILLFAPVLPHDPHKNLIHCRLPNRVVLHPQRLLVPVQQPEHLRHADMALAHVSTSGHGVHRHRKPDLPAVRLLVDLGAVEIPSDPALQPLHLAETGVRRGRRHHVDVVDVAPAPPQPVDRAQRQHAPGHDPRAGGQGVGLLHAVCRQDGAAIRGDGREGLPHDALGRRVEAAGGLVEEQDGRVPDQGDGEGELAFGAAGEFLREAVAVGREAEDADDLLDVVGRVRDAADAGVEAQVLGHG